MKQVQKQVELQGEDFLFTSHCHYLTERVYKWRGRNLVRVYGMTEALVIAKVEGK